MARLYVVATPIGNLEDITKRALRILSEVDLILCEDTRNTKKLLDRYNIKTPCLSYHQHSKLSKIDYILNLLIENKNLALVSDAGTPGISDPGGKLIKAIVEKLPEVKIIPIPGPNAAIAALSISGFPTDKFIFLGFPPHKKGRNKFFDEAMNAKYTVVFYESTHRILKTLKELELKTKNSSTLSSEPKGYKLKTNLVVCRELTKQFESIYRGSAEEILKILESDKNNLKGEFVVVVSK